MQTTIRFRWWVAVLLLSSCRSEQTAFSFRSAPTATSNPVAQPVAEAASTAATTLAVIPEPAISSATARQMPQPVTGRAPRPRLTTAFRQQTVPRRTTETTAVTRPQNPTRHDALHVVLGALLIVGGVVAGLALGGWLGLGVGAVVVLLGYYFVVLGIGGKHAWLEIFQEFFNM
ncbi:hypothetical protein [Hymenobacter swuensis]|uniref:Uncharacterized protein n=1 Tax=Hymenobacter swuensis DY53 TaxID=1227739 RepID=W8F3Q4_9BACT|nr:hypothetical protein [Hymenobacter swuensis]AHJ99588.1 hypothetical protein Hsw_3993 [Hymenobacter swuensis DY53]